MVQRGNNMARATPRFKVKLVHNREVTETIFSKNPDFKNDGVHFIRKTEKRVIPESYLVFFPGGHSTWFETKEAMEAAGIIDRENYDIDLDTGLPMEKERVVDLEALVNRKTRSITANTLIGE